MTKRGEVRRFAGGRLAHGACRPLIGNDRGGAGSEGSKGGGAAHFVILSGEKRRVLKNGLSENMRTESKYLSAAKYKNSLPLEGKVPRKDGGWLPQRDERECTIVRPLVSSSRAQPRDLSCRRENSTYEEVRHSKSYKVRCLPLPSLLLSDRCARKISRFARNDNTGKRYSHFPPI